MCRRGLAEAVRYADQMFVRCDVIRMFLFFLCEMKTMKTSKQGRKEGNVQWVTARVSLDRFQRGVSTCAIVPQLEIKLFMEKHKVIINIHS